MTTVARTPFAMVPLWVYRHEDVTPTVMQVYLALASRTYERKVSKNLPTLMADSGLKRSTIYESVATLKRVGAVHEDAAGWFLPIDPPQSTTVDSDISESTTVDNLSATVDSESTVADSHLFTLETSYLDTEEGPRSATSDAARSWPSVVAAGGFLPDAERLANLLADFIAERHGKRPVVSRPWVLDMEALLRIDERPAAKVEATLRWLHTGADPVACFWRPNVLSPGKLRARWGQMQEQYEQHRKQPRGGRPNPANVVSPSNDDALRTQPTGRLYDL